MVRVIPLLWRRFCREDGGAVLQMFVIVIVPLLLLVAVGTDLAQMLVVKRQLTGGVDAAALTLGTLPALTDPEAEAKAEAYIRAHYPEKIGKLKSFSVSRVEKTMDVTATAEFETTFLRVAGYGTLTVTVSSQAVRQENKLEVVMVLDNSTSMSGNKIAALKVAANTLVDTLMGTDQTSDRVKIALVPFTAAVNVGAGRRGAAWLDEAHPSSLNNEVITGLPGNTSLFTLFDAMHSLNSQVSWGGCVRARTEPYDGLDTAPDTASPATLFTPFLAPDDFNGFNNYITQGGGQTDAEKYKNYTASLQWGNTPNLLCPAAPIQELTNAPATIKSAVSSMAAYGNTVIPEGLAWGWRVISPGQPFTTGVPYDQTDTIKAIIVMTDGENFVGNYFSAFGDPNGAHLGGNTSQSLNTKLSNLCTQIKGVKRPADGSDAIVVYSIVFDQTSPTITNLMRDCATDSSKYFNSPSTEALQSAFEAVAASLNQLRVSK